MSIKEELYKWRNSECSKKNIESFRILPDTTLDSIALKLPKNKEELCEIKGIKEMKFAQYGNDILKIVNGENITKDESENNESRDVLTVSEYLNSINSTISKFKTKIRGEVVTFQPSGNAVYFTIKDSNADAILSVFMWNSDYKISGISIVNGLEIIVEGYSEIYKPNGRFSLRASTVELVGEGALKIAYDKLKAKLYNEGLFDDERKIKIVDFPSKIGVITSKQGAVIHDFLNNLGKFGFKVSFVDSRVEGVLAIKDIISAIETVSKLDLDVIVLIRGGGSLESLQAFNNEHVVRAISNLNIPVICSIGHDKDVPLAQMVSDYSTSTPSMCTAILNESWNDATYQLDIYNKTIFSKYSNLLSKNEIILNRANSFFQKKFSDISKEINSVINVTDVLLSKMSYAISKNKKHINDVLNNLLNNFNNNQESITQNLNQISNMLDAYDPLRQLKLGYSLVRVKGKVIKSKKNVIINDTIDIELSDGNIEARVNKIK